MVRTCRTRCFLLLATMAVGAGAGLLQSGDAAAAELKRVTIGALNNMMHLPTFIAVEKGLFVKQGIDAKIKLLTTGPESSQAFIAGETEYSQAASATIFTLAERAGAPRVLFIMQGDATQRNVDTQYAIVGRAAAGIRAGHPEDLAGKTLAAAVGGTSDQYFELVLRRAGVPRDKIHFLNMRPGDMAAALRGGTIDAFSIWEPFSTFALKTVPGAVLVTRGGGYLGFAIFYMASQATLDRDPQVARGVVKAYAEAMQIARRQPDMAAEIATRWVPGLSQEVARAALPNLRFDPRVSKYTVLDAQEAGEIVKAQGHVRRVMNFRDCLDLSYLQSVEKEAPELFSDLRPLPPDARP